MRKTAILTALLMALLVVAAPLAVAAGESQSEKGKLKAAEAKAARAGKANETAADEGAAAMADKADKAGHGKGKKGLAADVMERLQALRDSWKTGASGVREACHAAEKPAGENATKEDHRAWAHCIRDGYHKLFEALKLERKAIKAEAKAA